jgi:hypothetical protein
MLDTLMLVFQRRLVMNICKVLGGVACLGVLLGTGALAESGMKKETSKSVTEQGREQNVEQTHEGGAAKAAKELEAEGKAKRSHSGGEAKAGKSAEDIRERSGKSQKAISAQSADLDMKEKLPKKELEQADPPVKK